MADIPNIILQNPFRVLGVFANSPKKEIVANQGKATKFLQVGREVEYPLDLKAFMPKVERSVDIFNQASAALAIAKGQLKHAQFWFVKSSPLDDVAFNHLFAGDTQQAIEIWNKKVCASSLQNKMVCYYCNGDIDSAINIAEDLYEKYSDDFLKIADTTGTLQLTQSDLVQMYLDTLSAEVSPMKILNVVWSQDWKDYLGGKTVKPIIDRIKAAIKIAHDVDDDDANANLHAGNKLIKDAKDDFSQLKKILPKGDIQLESIADQLGLQILQCAINYYNKSNDDDAAEKALKLQQTAGKIVIGNLAKERCEDNGNTLNEIIESLPPKEIRKDHNRVIDELKKFDSKRQYATTDDAITLLRNTKAPLQGIKGSLGCSDENYLNLSTIVVQKALSCIVQEVNDAQDGKKKKKNLRESSYDALSALAEAFAPERDLKQIVKAAINATTLMDAFDMTSDFRAHYNKNKSALKSLCANLMIYPNASEATQDDIDKIFNKITSPKFTAGLIVPDTSSVNELKTTLDSIKNRGELNSSEYVEVSTMAVRGILNATIKAVNSAQSRSILDSDKEQLKKTISSAISVCRTLGDFEMDSECRQSLRNNSSTLSDISSRLNPGCLGSVLAIAATVLAIILIAIL